MSETIVNLNTRTVVDKTTNNFTINIDSSMNIDGTITPSIFKCDVIDKLSIIDNKECKEGELAMSYNGDNVGEINKYGCLIINPSDDDANKYLRGGTDDTDLLYQMN